MKSVKTGYLSKRPPLGLQTKCLSPQQKSSQKILACAKKSLTPVKLFLDSPLGNIKQRPKILIKKKSSKELMRNSNEETQSSNNLTLRLLIEPRNSPVKVGKRRPHSIKPLKVVFDDKKSQVSSPGIKKYVLSVEEDAIKRPYIGNEFKNKEYNEVPCSLKVEYWRRKGLEQYKIAKKSSSAKHSPIISPKRGTKKIVSELADEDMSKTYSPKIIGQKFQFLKKTNKTQAKICGTSKKLSIQSCGGIFILNKFSTPNSFCNTPVTDRI